MESWSPPQEIANDPRRLLNGWDPIGVADLAQDEYDCLIDPPLELLHSSAGRVEVDEYLWREVANHFGLDPVVVGTDAMADRLTDWWVAAGRSERTSGA